jgi:ABC-type polysaccharide/polyol phosphate transport system ATPase subunit
MARIHLDNVSLTFRVRQQARVTFKEFIVRRLYKKSANPILEVPALKDLNFEVREGERLGILGHNGAGKSTLLKVLAGIYPPSDGRLTVEGQISSLFEISLGFEQDASGWENIYYRGYLQGETPQTIRPKVQPIAEFSELGHFLDMPVRYYSAGMKVRLAFAIATAIDPQILLVDEVLSVGDKAFQEKAAKRMRDMMAKAQLIVLVSHDLESIVRLCHRAVWMDHGRIQMDGNPREVVDAYIRSVTAPQVQAA